MKPRGTRLVVMLVVASFTTAVLRADDPKPASKPPKRGGYGSEPAGTAPAPAAGPAPKAAATPDWMVAAEARRGAVIDEINQRFAAAKRAWAGSDDKFAVNAYRQFYSSALTIVTQASLRDVSNPTLYDSGPERVYDGGNHAAIDAALAALDEEMGLFRYYDGVVLKEVGNEHASDYLDLFATLPIFSAFERMATPQKTVLARRTDPLVPLIEVARRMDPSIRGLIDRRQQIANQPAIKEWKITAAPFVRFYDRQLAAIGASLRRWFQRGGATEAELSRIDAQMKATQQADPQFVEELQRWAKYEQQEKALFDREEILYNQIASFDEQARNLRGNKDYAGAAAVDAQAEPLIQHRAELDKTRGEVRAQEFQEETPAVAAAEAMNFVEAVPSGHVTAVEFILATEDEPAKAVVPEYPLKGAPVSLSLTRQVSEITVGIPFVVKVDWEQDDGGTLPAEQTLTLVVGGKTITLTLQGDFPGASYLSAPVIFQAPSTPAGPP